MTMEKMEILTEQSTENLWQIEITRRQIKGKKESILKREQLGYDAEYLRVHIDKLETEKTELTRKYKDQLSELLTLSSEL